MVHACRIGVRTTNMRMGLSLAAVICASWTHGTYAAVRGRPGLARPSAGGPSDGARTKVGGSLRSRIEANPVLRRYYQERLAQYRPRLATALKLVAGGTLLGILGADLIPVAKTYE